MALISPLRGSVKSIYRNYLSTPEGVDSYARFQQLLYGPSDTLIAALNDHVLPRVQLPEGRELRVLDVGTGDGHRIDALCNTIRQYGRYHIKLTAVEQSCAFAAKLKQRFAAFNGDVTLELQPFENTTHSDQDLTFLIHSTFAFEKETLVSRIDQLLKGGSTIILVSNVSDSLISALKSIVDADLPDNRLELSAAASELTAMGHEFSRVDFCTSWAAPVTRLDRVAETIGRWLSLGRWDYLANADRSRFLNMLQAGASNYQHKAYWMEKELAIIFCRRETHYPSN